MDDNFDGPVGPFAGDSFFAAAGSVSLVEGHYGRHARIAAGAAGRLDQTAFAGVTQRYFSRIYKRSANPGSSSQIFQIRSASAAIASASIRTSGQLAIHDAGTIGTNLDATATAVPTGELFRVEFHLNGTTFTATVYPDRFTTTPLDVITGTISGGTAVSTREGSPSAYSGMDLEIAWPKDSNTAVPGLRRFAWLTADITSGLVPRTVNVEVNHENLPSTPTGFSMDWGDGDSDGPQGSAEFSHLFTTAGESAMVGTVHW